MTEPTAKDAPAGEPPESLLHAYIFQLAEINTLIDQFEATRDQQFLTQVTEQMRHLAPKMKQFSHNTEGRSPEYSALRNKLTSGMREAVSRLRGLTPPTPSSSSNPNLSSSTTTVSLSESSDQIGSDGKPTTDSASSLTAPSPSTVPSSVIPPPPPPPTNTLAPTFTPSSLPQLEGWLKKQGEKGPIKGWKRRYFKQTDGKLHYFIAKADPKSVGYIDLLQVTGITPGKSATVFDLITKVRIYHLKAEDANDRRRWIEGLTYWRNVFGTGPPTPATPFQPSPPPPLTVASITPASASFGSLPTLQQPASASFGSLSMLQQPSSSLESSESDAAPAAQSAPSEPSVTDSLPAPPSEEKTLDEGSLSNSETTGPPSSQSSAPGTSPTVPGQETTQSNNHQTSNVAVSKSPVSQPRTQTVTTASNFAELRGKSALVREMPRSQSTVNARAVMIGDLEEQLSQRNGEIKRLNALVYQLRQQLKESQDELETVKTQPLPPPPEPPKPQEQSTAEITTSSSFREEEEAKVESSPPVTEVSQSNPTFDTLAELERRFKQQEKEFLENEKKLRVLQEEGRMKDDKVATLESELRLAREEMTAKDGHINQLNETIKVLRGMAPNPNRLSVSKAANQLKEELEKLKESNYAHQVQNSLLCAEIRRLQNQSQAQLQAKNSTIKSLQRELEDTRKLYDDLREKVVHQKDLDAAQPFVDELKEVKQELFYSMAVGIKLNLAMQGKNSNLDIQSLYDEAQNLGLSPKKWQTWISNRLLGIAEDG